MEAGDSGLMAGLNELLRLGRERGYLLLTQIHDLHDQIDQPPTWPADVAQRIRDEGIEVVDDLHHPELAAVATPDSAVTDSVRQYLNDIGRLPLLTAEEEVDLAKRYQAALVAKQRLAKPPRRQRMLMRRILADGNRAQERLVTANLRLVVSLSRRHLGRGLSLLELVQEGNIGLMRGVEKFDHTKGYKLSTYVTWWIRQALTRGVASKARSVRLPVHVHELVAKMRRTEAELLQQTGQDPTDNELADALGLTTTRLHELRMAGRDVTSLDRTIGDDQDLTLGALVPDEDAPDPAQIASNQLARTELRQILAEFSDRERHVMDLRYGLSGGVPHTLEEIGELYGVTRERVRQIERTVLAKLRHPSRTARLRGYSGIGDSEVGIA